jgi:glutamine amidotransferase
MTTKNKKVGIINYGVGNLRSLKNCIDGLGFNSVLIDKPNNLKKYNNIILPGVGSFKHAMQLINSLGWNNEILENIKIKEKKILGICLGMQVMCKVSYENGTHICLNWFDAEVVKLNPSSPTMKVPNIGWNKSEYNKSINLFEGLPLEPDFYFVHSYHVKTKNPNEIAATYEYGETVPAAIIKDNIFATQFHPEKSQDIGLKLLENFVKWNP